MLRFPVADNGLAVNGVFQVNTLPGSNCVVRAPGPSGQGNRTETQSHPQVLLSGIQADLMKGHVSRRVISPSGSLPALDSLSISLLWPHPPRGTSSPP